ncbi:hypothetical protein RchiOBHm_Chr3g0497091 [Rosa chinensis]|uniref:Uncharacterized protein n=1 Tax=Rosa chinensis TaxID=74649 RepID=A0A2P6RHN5_ROSCH|nr:hypothetical protein RchiOBHm_Chr3g0497091 [Rosa chinensis]
MLQEIEHPLGACLFDPLMDLTYLSFQLGFLVDFLGDEGLLVGNGLSSMVITFVSGNLTDGYFGIAVKPLNDLLIQLEFASGSSVLQGGGAAGSSSLTATVLANQDRGLA